MVAPTSSEGLQMPVGWRVPADLRKKVLAHLETDEERLDKDARDLRAWVNMQQHMPFLPESEIPMIKAYLVNSKNSMEKTKKGLDTYFTARTAHYDFFGSYNINENELTQYNKFMSIFLSKELTPDMTRVLVAHISAEEQTEEEFARMCRINLLKADACMRMDTSLGYELIVDLSVFTPGHAKQMFLGLGVLKTYLSCTLGALPSRVKHLHLLNPPAFYSASFNLIQPLFKEKLRNRVVMHDSLKSLYSYVSPQHLPKDLGGDCPSCEEVEVKGALCSSRVPAALLQPPVREALRPAEDAQSGRVEAAGRALQDVHRRPVRLRGQLQEAGPGLSFALSGASKS